MAKRGELLETPEIKRSKERTKRNNKKKCNEKNFKHQKLKIRDKTNERANQKEQTRKTRKTSKVNTKKKKKEGKERKLRTNKEQNYHQNTAKNEQADQTREGSGRSRECKFSLGSHE